QADGPVPVALALVSAEATPDRAALTWYAADRQVRTATVYRRSAAVDWQALGMATSDGTGRIAYEDRTVERGGRYACRLGYEGAGCRRRDLARDPERVPTVAGRAAPQPRGGRCRGVVLVAKRFSGAARGHRHHGPASGEPRGGIAGSWKPPSRAQRGAAPACRAVLAAAKPR